MARVIVVEDTADQACMIAGLLEAEGHTVETAENGKRALEAIGATRPDIVVTDLMMPEMNGLELVEAVARQHASLPIILMTAYGSGEVAMKALRRGAASYVPKRRVPEELVDTVERILDLFRARHQRERMLASLGDTELRFELPNDTSLIPPLVDYVQETIAGLRPNLGETRRMQLGLALQEALINAVHHGNLGVSSELRESSTEAYQHEIRARLEDPAFRDRRASLTMKVTKSAISLVVEDEGAGFDLSAVPDPADPARLLRSSGRGLYLIGTFMDHVAHNETGNRITMTKRFDEEPEASR